MKYLAAVLLLLVVPIHAVEYSVGVSPPSMDLGTVYKGTSKIVKFYIVTVSAEPFTVYLDAESGTLDYFYARGDLEKAKNYSNEDVKGWARFLSNPMELLPAGSDAGYGIKGAREVNFILDVPVDAEPGYHILAIRPRPVVQKEGTGSVGAQIAAVTTFTVVFNVKGEAVRSGAIAGVTYNDGKLETHFKNTGTVRVIARATSKAYDKDGNAIDAISPKELVVPGELKALEAPFPRQVGYYTVSTVVDFSTGSSALNSTIYVEAPAVSAAAAEAETPLSIWIFIGISIIIILSAAIYILSAAIYRWRG